ncbi:hypothetical protein NXF25_006485 [Crotalus adamanteus]|uniref:Uncharacterized protein n=1 Tax=Crotalus adamanteus TaxID=8729 RepID=A0AAW1C0I7_CROAD
MPASEGEGLERCPGEGRQACFPILGNRGWGVLFSLALFLAGLTGGGSWRALPGPSEPGAGAHFGGSPLQLPAVSRERAGEAGARNAKGKRLL